MRVLHLISSAGCYGAENMVLNLLSGLEAQGCGTLLGVFHNSRNPHTELGERAREKGLAVEVISCRGRLNWAAVRAIRGLIRSSGAEVIHTHGYKSDLYGFAAARPLATPLLATCHNWTNESASLNVYAVLDRLILRRFDRLAAVSENVKSSLERAGAPASRISVVDNGVDTARFAVPLRPGRGQETVIGMVGRLVPEKGFDYALRAASGILSRYPATRFLIVGDGPYRDELGKLARELAIQDQVVFAGQTGDMPAAYAAMDIVLLPSLNEGMPMTILEAMAASRPVIATRVGAVGDMVSQEQTGLLVPPGDAASLEAAMDRMLGDPQLAERFGQEGRRQVVARFSSSAMARKYLGLYREIAKDPPLTRKVSPEDSVEVKPAQ